MQLLPALDAGGVERSTLEIAAALVAAGHRAIVVSAGGRMLPALRAVGAEHVELAIGRKSPSSFRRVRQLRALLRDVQADIVHARSRMPAWVARVALRGIRERPHWITTVHGLNSPGRYSGVMCSGEKVICVSAAARAHVLRHWPDTDPERLVVIPRGIDPQEFCAVGEADPCWRAGLQARHRQLVGGRLLLLPARGTRLKGHAQALELVRALRDRAIDVRLLLAGVVQAGRENYVRELRRRANELGLAEVVACSEPLDCMRQAYAMADLVLQLSVRPESFGRTVLEALASGTPVLGWDHGGVGELLRELYPSGAVVPADVDGLASRGLALLTAPPPTPALPDRYTLARMQANTLSLYADLVARNR